MFTSLKERFVDIMLLLREWPRWLRHSLLFILIAVFCLYYPIGMIMVHQIDDDPDFQAGVYDLKGGSHTVAISAALIDQEINHHWTPNDPFFYPGSMLDRMPAFQRGIMQAMSRFSLSLNDQLGRVRGSSQADPDLQEAVGKFNYSPNIWIFDFKTSLLPTTSSEKQYRAGVKALARYNKRVSEGQATFERRSDNLIETINRIAADMGSSSAALDDHISAYSGKFFDPTADELFYETKGKLYTYFLLLRELKRDYADIIAEKRLGTTWDQSLDSLYEGAALSHFFVFNASPESQFFPNHLASQGFYLIRARTQLFEVTNVLLK